MAAFCALVLVDRGLVGLDDAIGRFYAGLLGGGQLDGVRLIVAETVAAMTAARCTHTTLGLAEAYVTRRMGDHDRADAMDAAVRAALH